MGICGDPFFLAFGKSIAMSILSRRNHDDVCLLPSTYSLRFRRKRTGLKRARGIKRIGTFVDTANDAVLINHEGHAIGKQVREI